MLTRKNSQKIKLLFGIFHQFDIINSFNQIIDFLEDKTFLENVHTVNEMNQFI